MGKILIVSDSHGLTNELEKLKETYKDEVDLMIHCGDSELFADDKQVDKFLIVRGNCDYESKFPNDILETYEGLNIFITHGHRYSVKSSLMSLLYRAKELDAKIVCFGHSHIVGAEMNKGILFLNPGSISLPRGRRERTYMILDIQKTSLDLRVYDFDSGELEELRQSFTL
ncbi:metallophosphoesterase [Bacillus massilinigeriensis]|uniref:metallophosphoesterase n=1 Tax=Bacillus massilionigeriensis TaxID=1805475 RepID=UPI00096B5E0A|nr:metallophosphoesterase [Bacillus massilionigeriensis]